MDLTADGRAVTGALKTDDGGTGSVEGKLFGSQLLDLHYNLPGRSGEAIVTLNGDSFSGPDKATNWGWIGMRLPGPAEPFGTWTVKTSRGSSYVVMLDRAGSSLYGTIAVPGGAPTPIGARSPARPCICRTACRTAGPATRSSP